MNILMVHNYYQQRGGEDVSTESEVALLREYGHHVTFYSVHNELVEQIGRVRSAVRAIWSVQAYRDVKRIMAEEKYDVMHVQNFFPLISPSVYFAAKSCGVPVVQSIRNYRLFCLNGFFHCEGAVCERCFGKKFAWPGVKRGCYRDSRFASFVIALMQFVHHHLLRSFSRKVDRFIALSDFVKCKLVESGIPDQKIVVKPNFVSPDPGVGTSDRNQFVFVGRLSPEKGIETLIDAWRLSETNGQLIDHELLVVGDGPERKRLEGSAAGLAIRFLGRKSAEEVSQIVGHSKCLIFPSEWYETFGRVAIEAYAKGVPVIASKIGAVQELVEDGRTGYLFEPSDPSDLAKKMAQIILSPELFESMSVTARAAFESKYLDSENISELEMIYKQVGRVSGSCI